MPVHWKEWVSGGKRRGAWYYKCQVDGQISQGRAKNPDNRKQKAKTRKEAEYFESIIFQRMCQDEPVFKPKAQPWTFERFVEERFRPMAKQNHRDYQTGARYCLTVLLAEFGSKLVAEISPFEIEAFKIRQRDRRKANGNPLKPKTVNIYLDYMSSIFTVAIGEKLRADNPCDEVMRLEVERITKRVLGFEDEAKLLAACRDHKKVNRFDRVQVPDAIVILVEGGFRPREFLTMKKSQVDLLNRRVKVISYKTGRGRRKSAQPKIRYVPIFDRALPHYQALMATPGETLYPYGSIRKTWENLCEEVGLEGFWLRWLRDTFKHRCELAGFGPFEIALMMGHSSPAMTMDYSILDQQRALSLMRNVAKTLQKEKREATEASPPIRLIPSGISG